MVDEGIMVNIKKCKFLVSRLDLLGMLVFNSGLQLGAKSMAAWFHQQLPRTFKDL